MLTIGNKLHQVDVASHFPVQWRRRLAERKTDFVAQTSALAPKAVVDECVALAPKMRCKSAEFHSVAAVQRLPAVASS